MKEYNGRFLFLTFEVLTRVHNEKSREVEKPKLLNSF